MRVQTGHLKRDVLAYVGGILLMPLIAISPVLLGWVELDSALGQAGLFCGAISPTVVALILTGRFYGRSRIQVLPRPVASGRRRQTIGLWGLAFILPALFSWLSLGLYVLIERSASVSWLIVPGALTLLKSVTISTLGEEWGWRGFLLPQLQQRLNPLAAGVIVGGCWALWHFWYFLIPGYYTVAFGWFVIDVVGQSLWFTWLYNRSGGSVWLAVFFHMTGNFWLHWIPLEQLGGTPRTIFAGVNLATGLVMLLVERKRTRAAPVMAPTDQ